MSQIIETAVALLQARMKAGYDGLAKFVIEGEGAIMLDSTGARAADEPADVTLTASTAVFRAILDGEMNPTVAFMTGKLAVDGDMGAALRLGSVLG